MGSCCVGRWKLIGSKDSPQGVILELRAIVERVLNSRIEWLSAGYATESKFIGATIASRLIAIEIA